VRGKKDEIELLHVYGIYPSKRLLLLSTAIDEDSAREVCGNLIAMDFTEGPITLVLNTPGGEWYNGMAIYDTIKACKNRITILGKGHVMSMGTIIMQAADERIVTPHCRLMIHHGGDGYVGNSLDFIKAGAEATALQNIMVDIYLKCIREKKPTYTKKALMTLLGSDTYMSAADFVELGLADKVDGDE